MNRRQFIGRLAGGVVLAAVSPVAQLARPYVPVLQGDGSSDDTAALQAWFDGLPVQWSDGTPVGDAIQGKTFLIGGTVNVGRGKAPRSFCYNTIRLRRQGAA